MNIKKLSARWMPRLLILLQKVIRWPLCLAFRDISAYFWEIKALVRNCWWNMDLLLGNFPSDYFFFPDLRKWPTRKRFPSNDIVIGENKAYSESFESLFYRRDRKNWNHLIKCIEVKYENRWYFLNYPCIILFYKFVMGRSKQIIWLLIIWLF